ncbi:MAG: hypothetical protein CMF41_02950 [Legionellales bacterium]|nr:hypothetical protein [Legionellales bacterium]
MENENSELNIVDIVNEIERMSENFNQTENQIMKLLVTQLDSLSSGSPDTFSRDQLVIRLAQFPIGGYILYRCIHSYPRLSLFVRDCINYCIDDNGVISDQVTAPDPKYTDHNSRSTFDGLIESAIGFDLFNTYPHILESLTSKTLCDVKGNLNRLPGIIKMCVHPRGIALLSEFPDLHSLIKKEIFQKQYTIPGFNEPLNCFQLLTLNDQGRKLLLGSSELLNLIDEDTFNELFTFNGQNIIPAISLLKHSLSSNFYSSCHYDILLDKISSDNLNKSYSADKASILQRILDVEIQNQNTDLYMLDNEKVIQKITAEGLNLYHDGCTVLGALASTEAGMRLLNKYPSLLKKANLSALNAYISYGLETDGMTALSLIAKNEDVFMALDNCTNFSEKIQDRSMDCKSEYISNNTSLREYLCSASKNILQKYAFTDCGRALILFAKKWKMEHAHLKVNYDISEFDSIVPIHSEMRCSNTGKLMNNPVTIINSTQRIVYEYETIYWYLLIHGTSPTMVDKLLDFGANPDTIIQPHDELRNSITELINGQKSELEAVSVFRNHESSQDSYIEEHRVNP